MEEVSRKVVELNINDILPNRFQPRIQFNEKDIIELSESIKEHGVIQPIVVRPLGDKYEIIAGERRYKASVFAGKMTIPAIVININDKESIELALIENVQRKDLTPIEEAISYKKILDMGYITQDQLAAKIGKTQPTIANKLRLLNLSDEVQEALLENKISERHARSLLKIRNLKEQNKMLNRIIDERLTVKRTDEEIEKMNNSFNNEINNNINNESNNSNSYSANNNFNSMFGLKNNNPLYQNVSTNFSDNSYQSNNYASSGQNQPSKDLTMPFSEETPSSVNDFFGVESKNQAQDVVPISSLFSGSTEANNSIPTATNLFSQNTNNVNNESVQSTQPSQNVFFSQPTPVNNEPAPSAQQSNTGINNNYNYNNQSAPTAPQSNFNFFTQPPVVNQTDNFMTNNSNNDNVFNSNQQNNQSEINKPVDIAEKQAPIFNFNQQPQESTTQFSQPSESQNNQSTSQTLPMFSNQPFTTQPISNMEVANNINPVNNFDFNQPITQDQQVQPSFNQNIPTTPIYEEQPQSVQPNFNMFNQSENEETAESIAAKTPEPIIITDYNKQYDPIMPAQEQPASPSVDFKEIINTIRECSEKIEKYGYKIDTEEFDLQDTYQVIFKIDKA